MIIYKCDYCKEEFDTLEEYQADMEKCKERYNNIIYCYNYMYYIEDNSITNHGMKKETMLLHNNQYYQEKREYDDYGILESTYHVKAFDENKLNEFILYEDSYGICIHYYSKQEMDENEIKRLVIEEIKKYLNKSIEKLKNNLHSLK